LSGFSLFLSASVCLLGLSPWAIAAKRNHSEVAEELEMLAGMAKAVEGTSS
jgi:hypothetical protein